jgi:branched-chain amino acid aminotransferase
MAMVKSDKIWMNGRWVPWDDAKIHVLSHVAHYASSVFEGIRAYDAPQGPNVFRLEDHIDRLMLSAKIYRMETPVTREQIRNACVEVVSLNGLRECYIRPLIYRGYENLGVNPFNSPVEVAIAAYPWGKYLGEDALTKGVAVKVSTWQRFAPNTLPAMAKASANYMNSQLIKMEALVDGYAEGIALDVHGSVSEGSGQNLFAVIRGELVTPPLHSSILAGITRDTVITLAREMNLGVREMTMPRELLYAADELFFTGTAVEVSPITSVDKLPVGNGTRGPITKQIQDAFFSVVRGQSAKHRDWLTLVPASARSGAAVAAGARPS